VPARWLQLLALVVLLGGCAATRPPHSVEWEAQIAAVEARTAWELQGKIGLRSANEAGSAFLSWWQQGEQYRMVFSGALGLGKLVLNGDGSGVTWVGRDGRTGRHADPEALIAELWGWRVPVAALKYWVRGVPDPRLPMSEVRFAEGRVQSFRQAEWTVAPEGFRAVDGVPLPSRVRIDGDDARLTVSISRWNPVAP
jgi:outer membrane lipoprotein LolB